MEISAALVKELWKRTQASMMDCKRALVASEGNIEVAIQEMRKAGQSKAEKGLQNHGRRGDRSFVF